MGLYPYAERFPVTRGFPEKGRPREEVLAEIAAMASEEDSPYHEGKISGSIYSGDEEHYEFLNEVFGHYSHANVLQRDMYPSATRFEGEIIAMTLDMLHGDAAGGTACGVLTSGGTESLMNPMLVYRQWGLDRGITQPNVVMPVSAHPGLLKGCHYFGIEVRRAALTDRYVADVASVRSLIDDNTVAIAASAGTYPHGVVDPIEELSDLALERGINLHVDGCLGGFILAWGQELGYPVPTFDFRLPGVTSISADTHKYGFALKGSSVLLYRSPELRRLQYFIVPDWSGGLYTSPGMSGSRRAASSPRRGRPWCRSGARAIAPSPPTSSAPLPKWPTWCDRPSTSRCWATRSSTSRSAPPRRANSTSSSSTTTSRRSVGV